MHQPQFINARNYEHYRHKTPRHTIYDNFVQSNTIGDGRNLIEYSRTRSLFKWMVMATQRPLKQIAQCIQETDGILLLSIYQLPPDLLAFWQFLEV